MRTTVYLEPEAYEKAQSTATAKGQSLGKVLGDAILGQTAHLSLGTDEQGFPQIRTGRPITSEEIKAMIAEDEEWEITRGDPDHPYYRNAPPDQEPVVTRGPMGLPVISFGRPATLEDED